MTNTFVGNRSFAAFVDRHVVVDEEKRITEAPENPLEILSTYDYRKSKNLEVLAFDTVEFAITYPEREVYPKDHDPENILSSRWIELRMGGMSVFGLVAYYNNPLEVHKTDKESGELGLAGNYAGVVVENLERAEAAGRLSLREA